MPSLISSSELAIITGTLNDVFDSRSRRLIVYKESTKISAPIDQSNMVFGFGESQQQDAFTYTEVTGVYPAVGIYSFKQENVKFNSEIMSRLLDGDLTIKVKKDCRDYINNGKIEKFVFDEETFLQNGEEIKISDQFWFFSLKETK